jgi:hypothetical protein
MLGNFGMLAEVMVNDADRPRQGNYLYGAFGRDFATLDGKRLMVVGLTGMQWRRLTKATGLREPIARSLHRLGLDFEDEGNRYRARQQIASADRTVVPRAHAGRSRADPRCAPASPGAPIAACAKPWPLRPRLLGRQSAVHPDRTAGHRVLPDAGHAARLRSFTAPAGECRRPPWASTPTRFCSTSSA